jgi:hypothetical protein
MPLTAAISKQPTEKFHSLKAMRLTIGFLAIGSKLIRTANAEERRSALWPPFSEFEDQAPSFWLANLYRHSPIFYSGRAQTDSIVDGDQLAQFM